MSTPAIIVAPRFDLTECRPGFEAAFVSALHARATIEGWYADACPREDRLIISVDVSDHEANCVLRTLRIDILEGSITVGPDSTDQLVTDLDTSLPGVWQWSDEPAHALAHRAADWLRSELSRPIERHEWQSDAFHHRKWVLADTGTAIVESDSQNRRRNVLGPPSRIVLVSGTPSHHQ